MPIKPRFVGLLGLADVITVGNAVFGFVAAAVAAIDVTLAAQLILLAAIADGLDGVVARSRGATPTGEYLDSLADVASFAVAPAVFVFVIARDAGGLGPTTAAGVSYIAAAVLSLFVAVAVIRLGLYTAYDLGEQHTEGMQTTLAATLLAAIHLAGVHERLGVSEGALLVGVAGICVYMMVAPVSYPELYARDALVMGGLQALALLFPTFAGGLFAGVLLSFALAYLVLAPRLYWRGEPTPASDRTEQIAAREGADD